MLYLLLLLSISKITRSFCNCDWLVWIIQIRQTIAVLRPNIADDEAQTLCWEESADDEVGKRANKTRFLLLSAWIVNNWKWNLKFPRSHAYAPLDSDRHSADAYGLKCNPCKYNYAENEAFHGGSFTFFLILMSRSLPPEFVLLVTLSVDCCSSYWLTMELDGRLEAGTGRFSLEWKLSHVFIFKLN